jgi:hypothetical protein
MGWTEPPEQMTGGKFSGKLSAAALVLTPAMDALKQYELQLNCDEVSDFQFGVIQGKEEADPEETYLAFTVRTKILGACSLAENYLSKVGNKETGLLTVHYRKDAEQMPLEAPDATEEQKQEEAGALAPAAVAHGNMDGLKKARKGRQKAIAAAGDGASCEVVTVDGEDAPLRQHEWTNDRGRATVRIYDDQGALSALTTIDINGLELPAEWQTTLEGPPSLAHMAVAAFGQLERWTRETAKANGMTAEVKRALADLLSWSRGVAGEYRQSGRLELVNG